MNIFEFKNYKKYVQDRIHSMGKHGRGQYRKIAQLLGIGSVNVSQIFRGKRDLLPEQALELAEFFGLTEIEKQYFMILVLQSRASTHKLRERYAAELNTIREKSQDLKQRLPQDHQLSEQAKAVFYSSWYYSGVRLLTSIHDFHSAERIAEYFQLPLQKINAVIEVLLQFGLCKLDNGVLKMGPSSTHLSSSDPLVNKHHTNWRIKAMAEMDQSDSDNLFLTLPCSLSQAGKKAIRKELIETIESITKKIDAGPEETLSCLNIDFFKF